MTSPQPDSESAPPFVPQGGRIGGEQTNKETFVNFVDSADAGDDGGTHADPKPAVEEAGRARAPGNNERSEFEQTPNAGPIARPSAGGTDTSFAAHEHVDQEGSGARLVRACVESALWAAWADAVGFISELATPSRVLRRVGDHRRPPDGSTVEQAIRLLEQPYDKWPVQDTVPWTRLVGGRGGADVKLLPGTYSDDTQMRLATSRSISPTGFAVDAFASVELPVFPSYGLGGGRATKAGATAMAKAGSTWAAPGADGWANAGGNGVVMRVAPHAYAAAAHRHSREVLLLDVIRNGVVTHGHPRALLPACLHVVALTETLTHDAMAPMSVLHDWIDQLSEVPSLMASDKTLATQTLAAFEDETKASFAHVWATTSEEMHRQVARFEAIDSGNGEALSYVHAAADLGLFAKRTLGVGTACFTAAYWLADRFQNAPERGILLAANAIGTDTDTIATMAGAHFGVMQPFPRNRTVLDRDYLEAETLRVVSPSDDRAALPMRYPDLDGWRAPRAQADLVGLDPSSGRVAVAGLGAGQWLSPPVTSGSGTTFAWQWFAADFGQTLLVKRRSQLSPLPASMLAPVATHGRPGAPTVAVSAEVDELRERMERANATSRSASKSRRDLRPEPSRRGEYDESASRRPYPEERPTLDPIRTPVPVSERHELSDVAGTMTFAGAVERARSAEYDPEIVGRLTHALSLAQSPEVAIAFVGHAVAQWAERAAQR